MCQDLGAVEDANTNETNLTGKQVSMYAWEHVCKGERKLRFTLMAGPVTCITTEANYFFFSLLVCVGMHAYLCRGQWSLLGATLQVPPPLSYVFICVSLCSSGWPGSHRDPTDPTS